jgi:prolyl-tRNA synthetase
MRWEKRPRLFLRTSEFLWQEGHTAHETKKEALEETIKMLEVYREVMEKFLALPVIPGEKTEGERFPGADNTFTCETMMSDTKALQAGTSHFLGQNFAKAFDIKFQNREGELDYVWTTSWGSSTRLIGAIIMTHSDDDGLIIPPRIAPTRTVVLPISNDEGVLDEKILPLAVNISERMNKAFGGLYTSVDKQFHLRPGDRFFYHLQKGVPLRLELGEKEFEKYVVSAVRRDTGERIELPIDGLEIKVEQILENIQESMYRKALAFRKSNTRSAESYEELKSIIEENGGFVETYFAGTRDDERRIKEETGATPRCMPLDDDSRGKCFITGKEGRKIIFAKAY